MPKKTTNKTDSAENQLEAKVDQMMDVNAEPAAEPVKAGTPPPLDIFDGNATPSTVEISGPPVLPNVKAKEVATVVETKEPAPAPEPAAAIEAGIEIPPISIDTPDSDAAIADIVAQEADQALAAEDAGIRAAEAASEEVVVDDQKHGHPIFWFIILLLVVVAVFAVFVLTNPDFELPFSA